MGFENCIIFPKHGTFSHEEWIKDLPIFQATDWFTANFLLTGNVKSVQLFRKLLKSRTAGKLFTQGYWLEGKKGL